MKRNMKNFLKAAEVAIGTGLYMLEHSDKTKRMVRERVGDQVDDLRDRLDDLRERASDTYDVASDRVVKAAKALRGDTDGSGAWNLVRFALGVGVGIGIGLLFAPANGDATRAALADKAREIGDNVRQRYGAQSYSGSSQTYPATGTGD
jgi:gas vesicle protein